MYPSKKIRMLDKKEYQTHKDVMNYPDDVDQIVHDHMVILKEKMQNNAFPFQDDVMYQYYEKFKDYK